AAPFGGGVENGPERIEIGRAAWVLTGIGGGHSHLAGPEMTDDAVAAGEHVVAGHIGIGRTDVVSRVIARWIRIDSVPRPAARRQRAAQFGDAFDVAAQLDLFREKFLAGAAIFRALVGMADLVGARELGGGFQGGTVHNTTSLLSGVSHPVQDGPAATDPTL